MRSGREKGGERLDRLGRLPEGGTGDGVVVDQGEVVRREENVLVNEGDESRVRDDRGRVDAREDRRDCAGEMVSIGW